MSTPVIDSGMLDPSNYTTDTTREELHKVITRMVETGVVLTKENIEHGLEAELVKEALRDLGVEVIDDGRRGQISPTSDHRGKVVLTFAQFWELAEQINEE